MVNPVIAKDGNTYENMLLRKSLKKNHRSPLNPTIAIYKDELFPNRLLKNMIEKFVISAECSDEMKKEYGDTKKAMNTIEAEMLRIRLLRTSFGNNALFNIE